MSNMISVASGFQYSVNIGYDLNNDDKLKNFIPTQSALTLLEDTVMARQGRITQVNYEPFTEVYRNAWQTLNSLLSHAV